MSLRPIFIGGCERSGTTFLGALLGAAPGAITVPESPFRQSGMRAFAQGRCPADSVARMQTHVKFGPWRAPELPNEGACPYDEFRDVMERLVRRYARAKGAESPYVWVDHSPGNMRLGPLSAARFPDARFVHVVRDGRGVAASIMPLTWGPNAIHSVGRYWIERVSYGLALETSGLAGRTIRVRYEDLLADPEAILRQLCAFCELEFTTRMLQGGRFDVPTITQHQHGLVGKPPEASRASAWERELSARQIEIFESVASEMLDLLGYPVRHGLAAKWMSKEERLSLATEEFVREHVTNPLRKWRLAAKNAPRSAA